MPTSTIVIKKYANRRLYDTSNSRYINLEDIAALVRNGKDLQVVDAASGEDVTHVTLTQIIVDDAREHPTGLPLELLRQLIVTSDRVGQEFILWYLKSAYDAYQKVQSSVQSGITEMQTAALSPLSMMKNFLQRQTSPVEALKPPNTELEQLRNKVAELEARLQKPPAKRKPARRAVKRTSKRK